MGAQEAHGCRIIISLGKIPPKQQVIGYILIKASFHCNRLHLKRGIGFFVAGTREYFRQDF
jgi:hypothetical protein